MGQFSISHIALVLVIVLIFFGPSKLPQLGQSIGKAIRGFKDGMDELKGELQDPPAKARIAILEETSQIRQSEDAEAPIRSRA